MTSNLRTVAAVVVALFTVIVAAPTVAKTLPPTSEPCREPVAAATANVIMDKFPRSGDRDRGYGYLDIRQSLSEELHQSNTPEDQKLLAVVPESLAGAKNLVGDVCRIVPGHYPPDDPFPHHPLPDLVIVEFADYTPPDPALLHQMGAIGWMPQIHGRIYWHGTQSPYSEF